MDTVSELTQITAQLEKLAQRGAEREIADPPEKLRRSAEEIGKSASGSWLGYHAHVYYEQFESPPPGAHFDVGWGLMASPFSSRTSGRWREYSREDVVDEVHKRAGSPDLRSARVFDEEAREEIEACRSDMLSILQVCISRESDPHLEAVRDKVNSATLVSAADVIVQSRTHGQVVTQDSLAVNQGTRTPPHVFVFAEVVAMIQTRRTILDLAKLSENMVSHLSRQRLSPHPEAAVGANVFIGHGRSAVWRELKDFIENQIGLTTDEFNSVSVAGVTSVERLQQMLSSAAIAFLVMTGEDEQNDGSSHARLNVVHEAGLFQGKLGFRRAIVLLEDGCEEFSNIAGLGQLRFPKGGIRSVFEDVRQTLDRENLVKAKRGES